MENKLKQLLTSLVKAGWKPYGIPRVKNVILLNRYVSFSKRTILGIEFYDYTLRSLVSKESGLWQFVCENCLVKAPGHYWSWDNNYQGRGSEDRYPEYRLIESALKDESELEDFLLNSIKLD